jgi:hypothetical protein
VLPPEVGAGLVEGGCPEQKPLHRPRSVSASIFLFFVGGRGGGSDPCAFPPPFSDPKVKGSLPARVNIFYFVYNIYILLSICFYYILILKHLNT